MLMYISLALGSVLVAFLMIAMISRMANRRSHLASGQPGKGRKTLGDMAHYGSGAAFPEAAPGEHAERKLRQVEDRSGKPWGW